MVDIQAGDVVVCVSKDHNYCDYHRGKNETDKYLRVGAAYTITDISTGPFANCSAMGVHLSGVPVPNPLGICSGRFRKVTKADEGFATWMRSLTPSKREKVNG